MEPTQSGGWNIPIAVRSDAFWDKVCVTQLSNGLLAGFELQKHKTAKTRLLKGFAIGVRMLYTQTPGLLYRIVHVEPGVGKLQICGSRDESEINKYWSWFQREVVSRLQIGSLKSNEMTAFIHIFTRNLVSKFGPAYCGPMSQELFNLLGGLTKKIENEHSVPPAPTHQPNFVNPFKDTPSSQHTLAHTSPRVNPFSNNSSLHASNPPPTATSTHEVAPGFWEQFTDSKKETSPIVDAVQKTTDQSENNECKVCFDNPINSVIVDCGHSCLCMTCVESHEFKVCPVCRTPVTKIVKVYKC
mmetsp:Transcript_3771/g.4182  ORF Transcript_3771/g.4182 Transcript_3771/m.4182 type:complete len:300 (-) Transcript_3771:28-927(-)